MWQFLQIDAVAKYKVVPQGAVPRKRPTPPMRNFVSDRMHQSRTANTKKLPAAITQTKTPLNIDIIDEQPVKKGANVTPYVHRHQAPRSDQMINFNRSAWRRHHMTAVT